MSILQVGIIAAAFFLAMLIANYLISAATNLLQPPSLVPDHLESLRNIVNSCAKSGDENFEEYTINEFLKKEEDRHIEGDEMHILTHDLEGYDSLEIAVASISQNLLKDVKYVYYFPGHDWGGREQLAPFLRRLQSELVRLTTSGTIAQTHSMATANTVLDRNVTIYFHRHALLYYFTVHRRQGRPHAGYWYVTSPIGSDTSGGGTHQLVTTKLSDQNREELDSLLRSLRKEAKAMRPTAILKDH